MVLILLSHWIKTPLSSTQIISQFAMFLNLFLHVPSVTLPKGQKQEKKKKQQPFTAMIYLTAGNTSPKNLHSS